MSIIPARISDTGEAEYPAVLLAATEEARALRDRRTDPAGRFDKAGRWRPSEPQPCCGVIRTPSRAWALSLNAHCRTVRHVAACYGIEEALLRGCVAALDRGSAGAGKAGADSMVATVIGSWMRKCLLGA